MSWCDEPVLVTGAGGFVGAWLVSHLVKAGTPVVVLLRDWDPQSELIRSRLIERTHVVWGRLEELEVVERAIHQHRVATVFHLGAETIVGSAHRAPLATFESNIRGTYTLLEACRRQADLVDRIIIASSDKAYGEVGTLPYTETMPLAGRHPYDVSKSCTDLLAQSYAYTYGLPITISRCSNIFGGGDLNWSRIVPGTIRSVLAGQRPVLRSDGTNRRDYLYVDDAVSAYLALAWAADQPTLRGEAFNFGTEEPVTVLDMTRRILKLMGAEALEPIILNQAGGEITHQFLDASKARQQLGWQPRHSIDEGLRRTIAWYRDCGRTSVEATGSLTL